MLSTASGFASSRPQARLMVTHGHFTVNGRRTDVPSMLLREGDVLRCAMVRAALNISKDSAILRMPARSPSWLNRDTKQTVRCHSASSRAF
jgi:small subunit ribosomal protein S4